MLLAFRTHARFYTLVFMLTMVATLLPGVGKAEEESEAEGGRRTTGHLIRHTYLGHAAQMPPRDEPVEVLERHLEQSRHNSDRPSPGRDIAVWKKFTQRYPNSRYAYHGLGRAYRMRFEKKKFAKDLQRAINAYAKASEIGLSHGRILYTRELSATIVHAKASKAVESSTAVEQLDQVFGPLIAAGPGLAAKEFYLALVDYGDGLAALDDERAWEHFEQAIALRPENNIEAINRYAKRMLEQDRAQEALDLLESRLSRDERIRRVNPAYLRKDAMTRLGLDTLSADEEIEEIGRRLNQGTGAETAEASRLAADIFSISDKFVHNVRNDDCRDPFYSQYTVCTSYGQCYSTYIVNLAEILWNEARGESWGQSDMVGWTVRNRVLQKLSCDVYKGGLNWSTCPSLPCSSPTNSSFCDLSRRYCCAEHGGTTQVGESHSQFNDEHVPMDWLEDSATITAAYDILNGRIPDPSTGFIPPNISGCNGSSCGSFCTTGANQLSPSPNGPMEYLGFNYCAARQECKWFAKNTCGNNPTPASCGPYGSNAGDNHFWNRRN